jgi:hypothetical protein
VRKCLNKIAGVLCAAIVEIVFEALGADPLEVVEVPLASEANIIANINITGNHSFRVPFGCGNVGMF